MRTPSTPQAPADTSVDAPAPDGVLYPYAPSALPDAAAGHSGAPARQGAAPPARFTIDGIDGLATRLLGLDELHDGALKLVGELVFEGSRAEALRRELAWEAASSRSRLRKHQAEFDRLLTSCQARGCPSDNLKLLRQVVADDQNHYLAVLDLFARLTVGSGRISVTAKQAVVVAAAGGDAR